MGRSKAINTAQSKIKALTKAMNMRINLSKIITDPYLHDEIMAIHMELKTWNDILEKLTK